MRSPNGSFALRVFHAFMSCLTGALRAVTGGVRWRVIAVGVLIAAGAVSFGVPTAIGGTRVVAHVHGSIAPARPASLPNVDVGHESLKTERELMATRPLPGPHVQVAGDHGGRGAAATPPGRLLAKLSTADSDTWQPTRGPRVTRIFAAPVNYRDAHGGWHPIQTALTRTSGGFANEANGFSLHLPDSLSSPLSLSKGDASVRFALLGAHGTANVSGATATYGQALTAASVAYRSIPSGVSEAITLTGSSAPKQLRFAIAASTGLSVRVLRNGTLELVDHSGKIRFVIPASYAYRPGESAGSPRVLASTLTRTNSGWTLTVDTGAAWLRRQLASGAMAVDPSVLSSSADCSIDSAATSYNACTISSLYEGQASGDPDILRALLQFNVSSIPADSTVLNAQLGLYVTAMTGSASKAVGVYRMTQAWTTATTWNTYDGTHSWATPGGDFSSGTDGVVNPAVGASTGWAYWYPTQMVQEWLDGTGTDANPAGYANDGMIVKDVTEGSGTNALTLASQYASSDQPYLQVAYEPRGIGSQSRFTSISTPLTDKMSLGVNPTSGNLQITDNDFDVMGTGESFTSDRTYNAEEREYGNYGVSWNDVYGAYAEVWPDGDVSYEDPTGAWFTFIKQGTGAFITPAGVDSTLCVAGSPAPCPSTLPSGVTYELISNADQSKIEFNVSGNPLVFADRYGNQDTISYSSGSEIGAVTDSQGRQFNYTWTTFADGKTAIQKITDVAGSRSVSFGYTSISGGYDELTSYVDANGNTTRYGYDSSGRVNKITSPNGRVTTIGYDGANQVTSITRVTNIPAGTGPTTDFAYYGFGASTTYGCTATQKATVVTDPDGVDGVSGHTTTYCANADDEVETTLDASGNKNASTFNPLGNTTSSTANAPGGSGAGGVQSTVYDTSGENVNCAVDGTSSQQMTCPTGGMSQGYATDYAYDSTYIHQASQVTDPQQNQTNVCYFSGGNPCTGSGGTGFSGPAGSVERQTDQLSTQNSLNYSYNSNGTIASSQDADGNTTSYGYDSHGNLTTITPPASSGLGVETITPDADSRPHVIVQCVAGTSCATSETATITYDNLDRITKVVYTGPSATTTIQYIYDKDGNLYQRIDPQGTTTYTVDALNRITNEADPGSVNYAYAYDDASNMTCFTDSGGNTSYVYNGLNELTDMYETDPSCGAKSSSLHTTFGYDNDHDLTKLTYASGVNLNYGLDPNTGRILSITTKNSAGTVLHSDAYTFTNGSNDTSLIQTRVDTVGSATSTTSYGYDPLNRLLSAVTTGSSPSNYTYVLDGAGNRTSQTVNPTASSGGTTTYYDYNTGNQLLCRMTTNAACSNSSSTEISGYFYDQAGRENEIDGFGDPADTYFGYNNADQTNSITPPSSSAETLSYLGDEQDDLTALGSSTLQNSQLGLTQQASSSGTSYYARTPQGMLIDERLSGGTDYNPVYDAQNDVVGLANSSGSLVQSVSYGPYGENTSATGSVAYSSTIDPFLFMSAYHTAGGNAGSGNVPNGVYHLGARFYDPTVGRWTQADPIRQIGSATQSDFYTFTGDNPVNNQDPSGTFDNTGPGGPDYSCGDNPYPGCAGGPSQAWNLSKLFDDVKACAEGALEARDHGVVGIAATCGIDDFNEGAGDAAGQDIDWYDTAEKDADDICAELDCQDWGDAG